MASHRLGRGVGREFVSAVFVLAGQETVIAAVALGYIYDNSVSSYRNYPLNLFNSSCIGIIEM